MVEDLHMEYGSELTERKGLTGFNLPWYNDFFATHAHDAGVESEE